MNEASPPKEKPPGKRSRRYHASEFKRAAAGIAQNEETCVVFGIPREAIKTRAAKQILRLPNMTVTMNQQASQIAL